MSSTQRVKYTSAQIESFLQQANDPNTPAVLLQELAALRIGIIARALANNPSTPPHILDVLAGSNDQRVLQSLAKHPSLPIPQISKLLHSYPAYFLQNPALPLFLLENPGLFEHLPLDGITNVARNASLELLMSLLQHRNQISAYPRVMAALSGAVDHQTLLTHDMRLFLLDVLQNIRALIQNERKHIDEQEQAGLLSHNEARIKRMGICIGRVFGLQMTLVLSSPTYTTDLHEQEAHALLYQNVFPEDCNESDRSRIHHKQRHWMTSTRLDQRWYMPILQFVLQPQLDDQDTQYQDFMFLTKVFAERPDLQDVLDASALQKLANHTDITIQASYWAHQKPQMLLQTGATMPTHPAVHVAILANDHVTVDLLRQLAQVYVREQIQEHIPERVREEMLGLILLHERCNTLVVHDILDTHPEYEAKLMLDLLLCDGLAREKRAEIYQRLQIPMGRRGMTFSHLLYEYHSELQDIHFSWIAQSIRFRHLSGNDGYAQYICAILQPSNIWRRRLQLDWWMRSYQNAGRVSVEAHQEIADCLAAEHRSLPAPLSPIHTAALHANTNGKYNNPEQHERAFRDICDEVLKPVARARSRYPTV